MGGAIRIGLAVLRAARLALLVGGVSGVAPAMASGAGHGGAAGGSSHAGARHGAARAMSRKARHHRARDAGGPSEAPPSPRPHPPAHPDSYYADPRSPGYIPYCDAGSLYDDPSSCAELIELFSEEVPPDG